MRKSVGEQREIWEVRFLSNSFDLSHLIPNLESVL